MYAAVAGDTHQYDRFYLNWNATRGISEHMAVEFEAGNEFCKVRS